MTQRVLILGAGGHGQVVADILGQMQKAGQDVTPIGYLDDNTRIVGQQFLDLPVIGVIADLASVPHDYVVVAIGNNATRRNHYEWLLKQGEAFAICCHPRAVISPSARIGPGCMICAGAVVNPLSIVGANVILNTGCTVDHHNTIGDHAHIAPGVHLGGEVSIGQGTLVGIGATIMPGLNVGAWSVVGAGSLVRRHVDDGMTVAGVPARAVPG
jgi:sugar O-acyltransferase (sialic acid O-acetyltransferase NeuD family)